MVVAVVLGVSFGVWYVSYCIKNLCIDYQNKKLENELMRKSKKSSFNQT